MDKFGFLLIVLAFVYPVQGFIRSALKDVKREMDDATR
jgi:hypothetical protein